MSGLTKLQLLKLRSLPWWDQTKRKNLYSPSEHVQTAERLAKEHNGILPRQNWLRKNGFGALVRCMYNYPELFSHIPQAKNVLDIKPFAEARDLARIERDELGSMKKRPVHEGTN